MRVLTGDRAWRGSTRARYVCLDASMVSFGFFSFSFFLFISWLGWVLPWPRPSAVFHAIFPHWEWLCRCLGHIGFRVYFLFSRHIFSKRVRKGTVPNGTDVCCRRSWAARGREPFKLCSHCPGIEPAFSWSDGVAAVAWSCPKKHVTCGACSRGPAHASRAWEPESLSVAWASL